MGKEPRAYQKFFAELKRRRVFNTAAIYGGVAFIVFQAADFVVPALRLSDSVSTAIVLVAACGFPVVVGLAWLFDLTPEGMKLTDPPREGELEAIVAQPRARRWSVGIAAAGGILLLLTGVGWHLKGRAKSGIPISSEGESIVGSVAVLPFLNLILDEDAAYLSEGIANELSKALQRVPGLKVIGRTSAFSFKNTREDLLSMAEELKVASLLEGSVGEAGDTVKLAVRLVGVGNEGQGWTQSYQLPKEAFLASLDQVSRDIAGQLWAGFNDRKIEPLVSPSTEVFSAYRDYLRGQHLAQQLTPDALGSAIDSYNRALLLDPEFAPAWSGLATAYVLLPEYGGPSMTELLPYAQAALDRAVAPGSETPEGYAASAYLKWAYLWDFPGAEADFRRSINFDPNNPTSRYWFAQLLTTLRRWDEAQEQVGIALELDPLSPAAYMTLGLQLFCARRDGAADAFRRALELAPEMHPAAFVLGSLLAMEGDLEGAAVEFDRFSTLTGSDSSVFDTYLSALSDPMKRTEAVLALEAPGFFGSIEGAVLLAHLGENDAALSLLDRAAQARSPYLLWANAMPQFSEIHSSPHFQGILTWVGL